MTDSPLVLPGKERDVFVNSEADLRTLAIAVQ